MGWGLDLVKKIVRHRRRRCRRCRRGTPSGIITETNFLRFPTHMRAIDTILLGNDLLDRCGSPS